MNGQKSNHSQTGPWRSLHGIIWLIGLYIIATHGWWWPEILVLIGINAIYEGLLPRIVPEAAEENVQ